MVRWASHSNIQSFELLGCTTKNTSLKFQSESSVSATTDLRGGSCLPVNYPSIYPSTCISGWHPMEHVLNIITRFCDFEFNAPHIECLVILLLLLNSSSCLSLPLPAHSHYHCSDMLPNHEIVTMDNATCATAEEKSRHMKMKSMSRATK